MDIHRQPEKKKSWKRYWPVLPTVAGIGVALIAFNSFGNASYVANRDNLIFGEVRRGDFVVQVRGVGTLVPKNIQWQAANVDGRVDNIAVEAGASVKQGDVIATLNNPKLRLQLQESTWELEAQQKEARAAEMELRSKLAEVSAEATGADLDFKGAKLKLDAEQQLLEKGIVSRITVEQSKLAAEQFKARNRSQLDRVSKMEANLAAMIDAHEARRNKLQNTLDQVKQQIDDLTVRARIDGVVQAMSLKLGQQVTQGTEAVRIAPHDSLVAQLDVQDFQVRDVALGQAVTIDTRSSKIAGKVVRIDPAVTNGVVKVEIALTDKLPPEARPDLSVEGVIDIERKADTLFVERPSFAQGFSKAAMYRVGSNGGTASLTDVQLGRASTRHIEVVGGLKEGDRVIVSDPSAFEKHHDILIR